MCSMAILVCFAFTLSTANETMGFFDFLIKEKVDKDDFLNLNIPMLTFKEINN